VALAVDGPCPDPVVRTLPVIRNGETLLPRQDRKPDELRPVTITPGVNVHAEGSCLMEVGQTRVLCTASLLDRIPFFRRRTGLGWVTAEYSMLPRATQDRNRRDGRGGSIPGRSAEIQRLIGRALRTCVDFATLGENQIMVDCDVLQADGGTRCASICGGWVALALATRHLQKTGLIRRDPIIEQVAAVSCGLAGQDTLLDMDFEEDSSINVDANFVMTASGQIVEIQCSAEGAAFAKDQLDSMLSLAQKGIEGLLERQRRVLETGAGVADA